MSDLEFRLRRLEDRAELQDLVLRYFVASDDDDYEALGSTLSADCVFIAGGFEGGTTRDEIVDFIRAARQNMGLTIHTPDFALLDFHDQDHASGLVGAHLEIAMAQRSLFGAVRYEDEYVRSEDCWRIHRRVMRTIHMGPWEDVATSLTTERPVRWPGADPQATDLPRNQRTPRGR